MRGPAKFLVEVQVEPLPGYNMLVCGGGEYLVINVNDTANSVMLDAHVITTVLQGEATGLRDSYVHGYGSMWTFKQIGSPAGDGEE